MRYLNSLLALAIFFSSAHAQADLNDSITKYSYMLLGTKLNAAIGDTVQNEPATCFFFREGQRLFLITAKHCVSSCDPNLRIRTHHFYDEMYALFRLNDRQDQFTFIRVPVKKIADTTSCNFYYEEPDVFVFEVPNPEKFSKYNSVEKFCVNHLRNGIVTDTLFTSGFPDVGDNIQVILNQRPEFAKLLRSSYLDSNIVGHGFVDRMNYTCKFNSGRVGPGNSGSPVFFKNMNGGLFFGGLIVGGNSTSERVFVLKPDIVINAIQDRIKKN